MNKELLAFLAAHFGMTEEVIAAAKPEAFAGFKAVKKDEYDTLVSEHTQRGTDLAQYKTDLATRTQELSTANSSITSLTTERDTFKAELATEKLETARLKPLAEYGEAQTNALRAAAEKAYNTFSKGNPDEAILNRLKTADVTALTADLKMWGGASYSEFGATCTKCNSGEHIQMRSSHQEDDQPDVDTGGSFSMAEHFRK